MDVASPSYLVSLDWTHLAWYGEHNYLDTVGLLRVNQKDNKKFKHFLIATRKLHLTLRKPQ